VRGRILDGSANAAHDVSDGGLLIALAEMAMASGIGATLEAAPDDIPAHAFWFGEDQARYIITVPAAQVDTVIARARNAGILAQPLGTTGSEVLAIAGEQPLSVVGLREDFEGWLPAYMAGETPPSN